MPSWIKEIVQETAAENSSFGYSPTAGLDETRAYIAYERNLEGGIQITPDDILFFNGLGDGINKLYSNLHQNARVIGPNPAYPTHSSAEAAHADAPHITYKLDPERNWEPDLEDLERKVKENKNIAAIIIINPDNPTGFVYPQQTLAKIVNIAREYGLFVISDEIYSNLAYKDSGMKKLASVIDGVPGIAMRGISKEFPWPGARCGWMEFYNRDKDERFDAYARSIINSKMLEVCSTTLPQAVLPKVMKDDRYYPYLAERVKAYDEKSKHAVETLSKIPEVLINPARGAFYMTLVFRNGALKNTQKLGLSPEAEAVIAPFLEHASLDQRFAYYLLAAKGICVVPLSTGFNSDRSGFRFTLLEPDRTKFTALVGTLRDAVQEYLRS